MYVYGSSSEVGKERESERPNKKIQKQLEPGSSAT